MASYMCITFDIYIGSPLCVMFSVNMMYGVLTIKTKAL